ncbi:stage II sporulation protein R [Roseburia hominis]|uniref:stage II sporulation protein R n=1 Tax=Roseburia hominis TaxID=301301 RepID=UPI001F1BAF62|nr:stage II sporulation protein R [Roseburia hominis]
MHTYKKILSYLGFGVLMIGGYILKDYYTHRLYQEDIATKVLRFHVVANSDGREDQLLKLKVRDAVGSYMAPKMKEACDRKHCEKIVTESIPDIIDTAEEVIRTEGYDYSVTAKLEQTDFPVKTYGSYTFPEGEYEALNVVIGEGEGHNWWCVMYPNMCFSGSVYEVVDDEAKESLERVLTPEEYESLMEDKNYEVRFKYLSFLD